MNSTTYVEDSDAEICRRCRWGLPALSCSCAGKRPAAFPLVPRRFRQGPYPLELRSNGVQGLFHRDLDLLCVALRPRCSRPRGAPCALVFYCGRSDGHWCDGPGGEQGCATL